MKGSSRSDKEIPCANTERQNDRSPPEPPELPKFTEPEQKNTGHESCLTENIENQDFPQQKLTSIFWKSCITSIFEKVV
jgi:hypothetical protein